jgi:hypothetical protein
VPGPTSLIATTSSTSFLDGAAGHHYKLAAVDVHGNRSGYAIVTPGGTLDAPSEILPRVVSLGLTSGNPSSGGAVFRLELPEPLSVRLAIFDLHGRLVRELIAGTCEAGARTVRWDGRAASGAMAPSGVYLASLDAGGQRLVRRVVLSR